MTAQFDLCSRMGSASRARHEPLAIGGSCQAVHERAGIHINAKTAATRWDGGPMDYGLAMDALMYLRQHVSAERQSRRMTAPAEPVNRTMTISPGSYPRSYVPINNPFAMTCPLIFSNNSALPGRDSNLGTVSSANTWNT
jgi:hypothetical protein